MFVGQIQIMNSSESIISALVWFCFLDDFYKIPTYVI